LIEGYCVANVLPLEVYSIDKALGSDEIKNNDLIIIDVSKLDSKLSELNIRIIEQISSDCHIPVCAISNHKNDDLNYISSWVDCFFKEPILEQLDNYFRIRFKYIPHSFPDRRYQERRSSQRRNEIEVSRFIDSVMPMPPCHIDGPIPTPPTTATSYNVGPFNIDTNCNAVSFKGKDLCLTDKEFKLFSLLATNVDRVFSADEIIEHLWPATYRANKSDLYQYMHLLRKKIEKDPDHPHWILTIKRVGYRLNLLTVSIS
jgi:DNA-binding winged helix-turn-helix (wHTH) protein